EPRRDDADHALVPVLAREHVRAPALPRVGPLRNLLDRLAEDPTLDGLTVPVQLLERLREPPRLVGVVGQQELEGGARVAEPGRVGGRLRCRTARGTDTPTAASRRSDTWAARRRDGGGR